MLSEKEGDATKLTDLSACDRRRECGTASFGNVESQGHFALLLGSDAPLIQKGVILMGPDLHLVLLLRPFSVPQHTLNAGCAQPMPCLYYPIALTPLDAVLAT